MRILLTNDDGYSSPGIQALCAALHNRHETVMAAPRTQQSGIGHAFTFNSPLYYESVDSASGRGYIINGTPSDCVKFSVSHLLKQRPDAVVSGINLGENSGISGHYSGTVAAAREGAFWGIPSIAFSACGIRHLEEWAGMAAVLLERILGDQKTAAIALEQGTFYNINFPDCPPARSRGLKITRQSLAFFDDRYREDQDEQGRAAFWIYGEKANLEESDDYDSRALINGYITLTPLHFDSTAHHALSELLPLERLLSQGEEAND